MMQVNNNLLKLYMPQPSHFNTSQTQNEIFPMGAKFNSSIDTEHTQQQQKSDPFTLLTCPSSMSIKTTTQGRQFQIKIFSQYLLTNSEIKRQKLQKVMQSHFNSLITLNLPQIDFLYTKFYDENSQTNVKLQKPKYFYHFMGAWIISMGYNDKQTKKYVLSKIYNNPKSKSQQISFYQKFYQNLGFEVLNQVQRLKFLIKLCENGWNFFIFQVIEIGDKLKKQKCKIKGK